MRDHPKKPTNTDDYLEALPPDQGAALQKLRKQILAAAPTATEHFGYGLPGFKLDGHAFLYFGATKKHCALYGMIPSGFDEELKEFKRSKGAIQFTPGKPIPAATVRAIVKAKVSELRARWMKKEAKTVKKKASKRN